MVLRMSLDADRRIGQVDQEHAGALLGLRHDDADLGALAPVMKALRPLITQWLPSGSAGGLHHRRIGAGAALIRRARS